MRRTALALLLVMIATTAAWSQQNTGPVRRARIRWIVDPTKVPAEALKNDVPVFTYYTLSNNPDCVRFERAVFTDSRFLRLSRYFFLVKVDGRRHADYVKQQGIRHYPTLVLSDSAGQVTFKLDEDLSAKRVLNAMGRTFLISMYNSGKRARERGDVRTALRKFQMLMAIAKGTPAADWANREIRRIAADAVKKLSQSKIALDDRDYMTAMKLLDDLVYQYRGTETYAEARGLYEKLAADPRAVQALKRVMAEERAARMLARARALEKRGEKQDALILYWDILRDVPNTPSAKAASARAKDLASDRTLALAAARVRMQRDGRQWLEMAWNFEKNHEHDKALEYYQKVIEHYPHTSYAKTARDAIDKLMETAD